VDLGLGSRPLPHAGTHTSGWHEPGLDILRAAEQPRAQPKQRQRIGDGLKTSATPDSLVAFVSTSKHSDKNMNVWTLLVGTPIRHYHHRERAALTFLSGGWNGLPAH
jgi:hypothetical protein